MNCSFIKSKKTERLTQGKDQQAYVCISMTSYPVYFSWIYIEEETNPGTKDG